MKTIRHRLSAGLSATLSALLAGAALLAVSVAASPARAQSPAQAQPVPWPTKPVRFIMPGAPGSSPDRLTRMLAERLGKQWGVQVLIDNKPGGSTRIGAEIVALAQPDGYTLLSTFGTHTMVKTLFPETRYDPIASFTPIAQMVVPDLVYTVKSDSPYRTLDELFKGVKARKTPLQYAHFGNGSSFHIYGLIMGNHAGMDVLPVGYKGEALQMTDLVGGQIESSFNSIGTAIPHIRSGAIRPLAVVAPVRNKLLPDVPTFIELGMPRIRSGGWFGVLGPAGLPAPIVTKVSEAVRDFLADPAVAQVLRDQAMEPTYAGPERFGKLMEAEVGNWAALIKEYKVSPN